MWRSFYAGNPLMGFALFALLLFVVLFVAGVVRAWRKPRHQIADLAAMPLFDDDQPAPRTETGDV